MHLSLRSAVIAVTTLATSAIAAEIKPIDPNTPLFRIFAPIPMKPANSAAPAGLTFDGKHPLLVVRSVNDLRLARDRKDVIIALTPGDAQKFAAITRKYTQGLLLLEAEGRVLEVMQITAPITDGIIGFKYPDQAAVAEYLRRRFRIAEFR